MQAPKNKRSLSKCSSPGPQENRATGKIKTKIKISLVVVVRLGVSSSAQEIFSKGTDQHRTSFVAGEAIRRPEGTLVLVRGVLGLGTSGEGGLLQCNRRNRRHIR